MHCDEACNQHWLEAWFELYFAALAAYLLLIVLSLGVHAFLYIWARKKSSTARHRLKVLFVLWYVVLGLPIFYGIVTWIMP